jgi:hypothetical protein
MSQGCEERQHSTYVQKKTKKKEKKVERYEQLLMIVKDRSQ